MYFRLLSLPVVALLSLIWASSIASAQSGAWCARMQGSESCGFSTLSQCRATISGSGGNCFPNPRGAGVGYGPPPIAAAARRARAEQARNWRQAVQERRRAKLRERRELARERQRSASPPSAAPGPTAAMSGGGIPVSELDVNAVPNLTREGIRRVQMVLKEKGFDPGPASGVANPRLQAAIRTFQSHYGIDARGEIDNQTLLALGEANLASQSSR